MKGTDQLCVGEVLEMETLEYDNIGYYEPCQHPGGYYFHL